jgi:signal transduction histidine kinase
MDVLENASRDDVSAQKYLNKITELSTAPASMGSVYDIAGRAVKCIAEICKTDQVYALEAIQNNSALRVCALYENMGKYMYRYAQTISMDKMLVETKLTDDVSVLSNQAYAVGNVHGQVDLKSQYNSCVSVSISGESHPWGSILVYFKSSDDISKAKIAFLQAVANVISVSVKYLYTNPKNKSNRSNLSIIKAKQDWETSVDSLTHLVIVLNHKANVIRTNKTIEKWGLGRVNRAHGQHVSNLLKALGEVNIYNSFSSWKTVFHLLHKEKVLTWESSKKYNGKYLRFTLRENISVDYNTLSEDQNYAVLAIDDISVQKSTESVLKEHNSELEQLVNERTKALKVANKRLRTELHIQKQQKEALVESERKLHSLSGQLIHAQEQDRKRISNDLHDGIGQTIGAIKFKIEELLHNDYQNLRPETNRQLHHLVVMLKDSIEEVRKISMELRPSTLDDLGIIVTINWFCREFESIYTTLTVNKNIELEENEVPDSIKLVIYRIMQEAFNNIAKYADATNIELILKIEGNIILLEISDNGCGFNIEETLKEERLVGGLGLKSMNERAKATGATLSISSTPVGTKISAQWELELLTGQSD